MSTAGNTSRIRVGCLRHNFLPASETFIHSSLRALAPLVDIRVFAARRLFAEKFPFDDITVLRDRWWGALEDALYRTTTWSPRFFAWAKSVDILHAHLGYTGAHALLARSQLQRPLVVSFYGNDVTLYSSPSRFSPPYWHYTLLRKQLFRIADRILVLSGHMRERMIAQGCPPEKLRTVRLGIDFSRFDGPRQPSDGPCRVLMVGREIDKKGFDDGLRACARARELGADLRVVFLGTGGPLLGALQALAHELGLDVTWLDPATRVPGVMASADILLVPSRTAANGDQEGTPTVICEGGAAGLPVISTRHAGIPEQVEDGHTGLLANERDIQGLAQHLARLCREPDTRSAMGEAGRQKMRSEYDIASHAQSLYSVYQELL